MSPADTCRILNQLIAQHGKSLAVYLADAQPWAAAGAKPSMDVLRNIANGQQDTVDRLADIVMRRSGQVNRGAFPMSYTSLHDLSIDFLLEKVQHEIQEQIPNIESAVAKLSHDPLAKASAEEALGAAKAHLDSIREIGAQPVV